MRSYKRNPECLSKLSPEGRQIGGGLTDRCFVCVLYTQVSIPR